ncbi:MAG: gas vesicle protein K [Planctomycetes bacterium]|nr:gas vesicle protein K [Planctomycetota bacterium]
MPAVRLTTDYPEDFIQALGRGTLQRAPRHLNLKKEDIGKDLAKLVLTLIELLRQLLEKQALRRMEGGGLSEGELNELGLSLMRLEEEMDGLKQHFGFKDGDLNIDLGPIGKLLKE